MMGFAMALLSFWWLRSSETSRPPAEPPSDASPPAVRPETPERPPQRLPERLKVEIVSIRPHDPQSYTQGLLWHEGALYESAGQYGVSSLRQVDLATGEVRRRLDLPKELFAEGLALVGDRLIQLTWREEKAVVYRLADFGKVKEFPYTGEGWGLCHDGRRLVMSDGSDRLTFRDPETFEVLGQVRVTLAGRPMERLNELECVNGQVWANVWLNDEILRIDPRTGEVTAVVDASGLLTPEERARAEVLNGIAWIPTSKTFLLTGKLWPKLFEVKIVPAGT
jgi:glutaminyl-peptide cyclotransferase